MTWIIRASHATRDLGAWAAWTRPVRILGIRRVVELGYLNPRPFAAAMLIIVAAWAICRARRGDVVLVLAAGALAVHAYFVLAVQVHENHLYLAVPLLAGFRGRPRGDTGQPRRPTTRSERMRAQKCVDCAWQESPRVLAAVARREGA